MNLHSKAGDSKNVFLQTPALEFIFGNTWSSNIFAGTFFMFFIVTLWFEIFFIFINVYCRTPDQTKIKIKSNQKSGEAL